MDQIKIGKLIAKQRKEKGLTQQDLGDKVGVGYRAVSKWETGQTLPDISIINELSEILGITADELLKGELNKQPKTTPKSKKKYLLLLIPLIILIISIIFIIKQNNKVYEYDLKSADATNYYVEGKLTVKGSIITININKVRFNDYSFKDTIIKNYEYDLYLGDHILVGTGYVGVSNNMEREIQISEFQKVFRIDYYDKLPISKQEIIDSELILEYSFIDANNDTINKRIGILIMTPSNDKSTN